jgi:2'-5' RNA ligase
MEGLDGARWQSDEQLHLTLRFVGEVERPQADDLALALSRISFQPLNISIHGVGHFEKKGRVHTIWAQVVPTPALTQLQKSVEHACRSVGLADETRKFTPHITLARVNSSSGDVTPWLAANANLNAGTFTAERFVLCESELTPNGSVYGDIAYFPALGADI